ncbi:MAG: D-glycerate dehydrogenase [Candidatus Fischerbacteria bacterium RBG_13_37_8]|uniref:D-glycerate dehydrogenase n=1 Tax=Candidatus Fischerbacteria bacterium RBG_13_37_8 TaxID=1817863 RepID=A0A1F5VTZ7_9BACT|nr:MAG: D-glycerate dehydrogenase [Candidatus Fischerbacteria bacterium RBG_13_37_8]
MKHDNVFITRLIPQEGLDLLKRHCTIKVNPEDRQLAKHELIENIVAQQGLMCLLSETIDRDIMEAGSELEVISNYAVGYNNIDIAAATELGIAVCNTPGVLTETTADLVWALILSVSRRITEADNFTRQGHFRGWEPMLMLGCNVYDKILGIIGMGRIGKAVARRATGFSMKIMYHDKIKLSDADETYLNATYCSIDELLRYSDFISLHTPLSEETHKLIGAGEFQRMKPGAILINTSRGQVVDETALVEALENKQVAGAGLDVYEEEPVIHSALLSMKNVVLLPHIGSATVETRTKMALMAAQNIIDILQGSTCENIINPQALTIRK